MWKEGEEEFLLKSAKKVARGEGVQLCYCLREGGKGKEGWFLTS